MLVLQQIYVSFHKYVLLFFWGGWGCITMPNGSGFLFLPNYNATKTLEESALLSTFPQNTIFVLLSQSSWSTEVNGPK